MRTVLSAITVAALLGVSACGSGTSTSSSSSTTASAGAVRVVASTDVYGAIVRAVGGDAVTVTSLIDEPSKDPHDYEATPADAAAVASSQLAVVNGGGYDDFATKLIGSAGGDRTIIDVATLSGLEGKVPAGEEFNEHMWFNLPTIHTLAGQLAEDLSTLRPADAATFTANAHAFGGQLDTLQQELAAIAQKHPEEKVAATEPLPLYLLADADLVNVTPAEFMKASETGSDAPAAVVQETLQVVIGPPPVGALLLNTQTQNAATDRLRDAAGKAGVPEVAVSETLTDGQTEYVPWMRGQIRALASALDS